MSTATNQPGPVTGTDDALFGIIEKMQSKYRPEKAKAWGSFLDAGTGAHSLQWVRKLPLESWVAVTADKGMQATVEKELATPVAGETAAGRIVLGNWDDGDLLVGEAYDVVLADYLIGARGRRRRRWWWRCWVEFEVLGRYSCVNSPL